MTGLLLKDFLVIIKQLKLFLIFIPLMALTGELSMSALAVLLGAVLPMTAIAYDERSKWNELAIMMPYSKKDLVTTKYILGYICMIGASVFVIFGQLIAILFSKKLLSIDTNLLLLAIAGGLIFIAINMPILFKYGSEKGRFVFIIAAVLIGASGPILQSIDPNILSNISKISPLFLVGIALVANYISLMISIRIKEKDK